MKRLDLTLLKNHPFEKMIKEGLPSRCHLIVEELITYQYRTTNDIVHLIVDKYFTEEAKAIFLSNRVANFKWLKGRVYSHFFCMHKHGFFLKSVYDPIDGFSHHSEGVEPSTLCMLVGVSFDNVDKEKHGFIFDRIVKRRLAHPLKTQPLETWSGPKFPPFKNFTVEEIMGHETSENGKNKEAQQQEQSHCG